MSRVRRMLQVSSLFRSPSGAVLSAGPGWGSEGDLVDVSGSLDGEAASWECCVDCGGVMVDVGDGAENGGGRGRGGRSGSFVALERLDFTVRFTMGCLGKADWLLREARGRGVSRAPD